MKKFGEKEAWAYPGTAQFLGTPYYLRNGNSYDFKFGQYILRVHPNKSPLKNLEKGSVGVSRDCPIFSVTPIISGTDKATKFKYRMHI